MTDLAPSLPRQLIGRRARLRLSPATRVTLGLVSMMILLLLVADLLVAGFFQNSAEQVRRERALTIQLLAGQVLQSLQTTGTERLDGVLHQAVNGSYRIRSAAVQLHDGRSVSAGPHAQTWSLAAAAPSTLDQGRATLLAGNQPWGEVQVAFEPASPSGLMGWLKSPWVQGPLVIGLLGFLLFHLYLRRAMAYLDPRRVVPDRVRAALDTLAEGVVVLDTEHRIMLANRVFRTLVQSEGDLVGMPIDSLAELTTAVAADEAQRPWQVAQRENRALTGQRIELHDGESARHVIINCSPIGDDSGSVRGCLVSLSDVTSLHERTEKLRKAMDELEASREQIKQQNEELTLLATRDPLTGCLNRRALMTEGWTLLLEASQTGRPVSCVMCDIDHFKRVNDTYGHGGGDLILQSVAKKLSGRLRSGDLLARFGGEEFCLLLANADLAQAREIAERLRADIEAQAGQALRHIEGVKVTMSFGVDVFDAQRGWALEAGIDRADKALYQSKHGGRNRVTVYEA